MTNNTIVLDQDQAFGPKRDFSDKDIAVNELIQTHSVEAKDWAFQPVAVLLWTWFDIFNYECGVFWNGPLPKPHLRFEKLRRQQLGCYHYNHDESGCRFQIIIDNRRLHGKIDVSGLLKTWLHELIHEWQELRGRPGRGNYHNNQYRDMAKQLGIPCSTNGITTTIPEDGLFHRLLMKYGVPAMSLVVNAPPAKVAATRMLRWQCGCSTIRAAVEVEIKCIKCNCTFEQR